MREIKFRGKNKISGIWEYGLLLRDGELVMIAKDSAHRVLVDSETVGQYINLKDKKGNEIYEGDIARQQRYRDTGAGRIKKGFKYKVIKWIHYESYNGWNITQGFNTEGWEVVGNKFDNNNLLAKLKW